MCVVYFGAECVRCSGWMGWTGSVLVVLYTSALASSVAGRDGGRGGCRGIARCTMQEGWGCLETVLQPLSSGS